MAKKKNQCPQNLADIVELVAPLIPHVSTIAFQLSMNMIPSTSKMQIDLEFIDFYCDAPTCLLPGCHLCHNCRYGQKNVFRHILLSAPVVD